MDFLDSLLRHSSRPVSVLILVLFLALCYNFYRGLVRYRLALEVFGKQNGGVKSGSAIGSD